MYRISEDLAKLLLSKIKPPVIESSGENVFLPKDIYSVGIIDPICCVGSMFPFLLECPVPIVYPEFPFVPVLQGYFLYHREELMRPDEPWMITEATINPMAKDYETQIDCSDCAIVVASDTEKLTAKTISTLDRLLELEPLLMDCLNLNKR